MPYDLDPKDWLCTGALAATHALPRSLDGATAVLGCTHTKDKEGHRLMLKMSKPRKKTKNNSRTWHCKRKDLTRLMQYCAQDVAGEAEIFLKLPAMSKQEQELWCLDQRINQRGFRVDRDLVHAALKVLASEMKSFTQELQALTSGEVNTPGQRDVILRWLARQGCELENLQAKTLDDTIAENKYSKSIMRVLKIRRYAGMASIKKWKALELRTRSDGWLRDILVFHAASTGRWGGAGFQPQNLPRGNIKDTIEAAEVLKTGDVEMIRMLYGEPMDVLSSCLRNAIIAPEGCELFVGDYAAIEARKLFWVADHAAGVAAFHKNAPMYEEMAMVMYSIKKLHQINSEQRFVGKQTVLGCGYGMGWKKFQSQCLKFGVVVSDETAKLAVYAYRKHHAPVPALWGKIERAAIAAVKNPGKSYTVNKTCWYMKGLFLYCRLPSGRRLAYYGPKIIWGRTPWGEKRPQLHHWGIDSRTKKWRLQKTWGGTLVENVVQAISRDFMAEAMLRCEAAGYTIGLTVHDELLTWRLLGVGTVEEFCELMAQRPAWAEGAPVKVEGWKGARYKK